MSDQKIILSSDIDYPSDDTSSTLNTSIRTKSRLFGCTGDCY